MNWAMADVASRAFPPFGPLGTAPSVFLDEGPFVPPVLDTSAPPVSSAITDPREGGETRNEPAKIRSILSQSDGKSEGTAARVRLSSCDARLVPTIAKSRRFSSLEELATIRGKPSDSRHARSLPRR